jgi:hypothetical protein
MGAGSPGPKGPVVIAGSGGLGGYKDRCHSHSRCRGLTTSRTVMTEPPPRGPTWEIRKCDSNV